MLNEPRPLGLSGPGVDPQATWANTWYAIRADAYRSFGGTRFALMLWRTISDPMARHLAVWRVGAWARHSPRRVLVRKLAGFLNRRLTLRTRIEIPFGTRIGPGLRIGHRIGGVLINEQARLGQAVTIAPGVVIGNNGGRPGAPTIGDRVVLHVGVKVIGAVTIGAGTQVGAGSVVVRDLPAGVVAAGVPARVLEGRSPHPASRTDIERLLGPQPSALDAMPG